MKHTLTSKADGGLRSPARMQKRTAGITRMIADNTARPCTRFRKLERRGQLGLAIGAPTDVPFNTGTSSYADRMQTSGDSTHWKMGDARQHVRARSTIGLCCVQQCALVNADLIFAREYQEHVQGFSVLLNTIAYPCYPPSSR